MLQVFGASNVELVTKTRVEHLTDQDKARCRGAKTPLQSFLGIAETEERSPTPHVSIFLFLKFNYLFLIET